GAELSYTLQAMRGRQFKHATSRTDDQLFIDPQWVVPVMVAIGRDFDAGRTSTADNLAARLSLPHRAVHLLTQKLQQQSLIHQVHAQDDTPAAYTLAQPPDRLPVATL